jgi:hypothetical protein
MIKELRDLVLKEDEGSEDASDTSERMYQYVIRNSSQSSGMENKWKEPSIMATSNAYTIVGDCLFYLKYIGPLFKDQENAKPVIESALELLKTGEKSNCIVAAEMIGSIELDEKKKRKPGRPKEYNI